MVQVFEMKMRSRPDLFDLDPEVRWEIEEQLKGTKAMVFEYARKFKMSASELGEQHWGSILN